MFREEDYMMWLSRIEGLNRPKIERLLAYFSGSAEAIWNADLTELKASGCLSSDAAARIQGQRDKNILSGWIEELELKEMRFISCLGEEYPSLLKNTDDRPLGLYIRGRLPDEEIERVGIVGARRCSEYGSIYAKKFAKELSEHNVCVVSGMARGIDSCAHKGALEGLAPTIAVLGCGADVCYPAENRELMNKILENGCILSEYPPLTPPKGYHFPQRNRIIAGLSNALVVIEAGEKSGSLITAEMAIDFGRDVFVLPGNINSPLSKGTNALIKDGAQLLDDVEDILLSLGIKFSESGKEEYIRKNLSALESDEKTVYDIMSLEPSGMDDIMMKTDIQVQSLQYILTMLEIKGYIKKLPGERYIRKI